MPLAALRLVNPPRKRRSTARRRVVQTPSGPRFVKKVAGRWQFAKGVPGRGNGRFVKVNPRRRPKAKAKAKRRNPLTPAMRAAMRGINTGAKKTRPKRKRAAGAAPKRRRTTRATRPKRSKTVAKKRTGGRKTVAKRKMKALWAKARRLGKKTIKGVRLGAGPKRRKRKATKRRRRASVAVRFNPPKRRRRRLVAANPRRRVARRRRVAANPRKRRVARRRYSRVAMLAPARKGGKRVTWRIAQYRRRKKSKKSGKRYTTQKFGYSLVRRNPGATLKKMLPIYGGVLAIRALSGLVKQYIPASISGKLPASVLPVLPAAAAFLFATMLAPKISFLRKHGAVLEGMKIGSTFAVFDAILKNLILPQVPQTNATVATIVNSLAGYDDVGVQGYGLGAYIADNGHSLPGRGMTSEPGVGLDAHEAMALDEYVADGGMGFDVAEQLAGSEIDYMQRGGAGGSLSKTVFTD